MSSKTINQLFAERAAAQPGRVAMRRKVDGRWEDVSWQGYRDAARKIGLGLVELGLEPGHTAALVCETRAEWAFCDMGILGAGGVTVPIYHSSVPSAVQFIVADSGARFVILENLEQWAKVHHQLDAFEGVHRFVLIDTDDMQGASAADHPWESEPRVITLDALIELGEQQDAARFDALADAPGLDDTVTLIYTSGTTGQPKGVILTHRCATAEVEALAQGLWIDQDDVTLAFLPLAHVFARVLHWAQLKIGFQVAFSEGIQQVVANLGEIQPTFFAAVPRLYEKIHAGVLGKIHAGKGLKKRYALWALDKALARKKLERQGGAPGLGLKLSCAVGDAALGKVKAGIKQLTGGQIKFFVSGGAPLSPEIADFLWLLELPIYEGYGLTETTAATHLNRPDAYKIGTVGKTVHGAECKLAPDNEILLRGDMIMQGYHGQPEATAEVLVDGWFHTGDIGEIDAEGYLRITDRKKDLIVTAAGKNVAPQAVENHVKTHALISQVALFGDKQKFCVALLTIDQEAAHKALRDAGVDPVPSGEALTRHSKLKELVQDAIEEKNADLASYESIKYFEILPTDFEIGDELTPTMKVKRKVVREKYGHLVDALYANAQRRE